MYMEIFHKLKLSLNVTLKIWQMLSLIIPNTKSLLSKVALAEILLAVEGWLPAEDCSCYIGCSLKDL